MLKRYSMHDVMAMAPCYNPVKRHGLSPDWEGTIIDIINTPNVPACDKLWAIFKLEDRTNCKGTWVTRLILLRFIYHVRSYCNDIPRVWENELDIQSNELQTAVEHQDDTAWKAAVVDLLAVQEYFRRVVPMPHTNEGLRQTNRLLSAYGAMAHGFHYQTWRVAVEALVENRYTEDFYVATEAVFASMRMDVVQSLERMCRS